MVGRAILLLHFAVLAAPALAESGKLSIVGSDTMAVVLTDLSREFQSAHPEVSFEIQTTGSAAAPPALAEGTVNFGAMSRTMSSKELADFRRRRGFEPEGVQVASDEIALIVHPINPLRQVSRRTLDGIFSISQRCGGPRYGVQWSSVLNELQGFSGAEIAGMSIQRYSRTALSGSYGYFRKEVLCGGDLRPQVMELPGFAAIMDAVARSPGAIGYVGAGFVDPRVRVLAISNAGDEPGSGLQPGDTSYPFSRPLYLYTARPPGQRLSNLECAFLEHVAGPMGQAAFTRHGFQSDGLGLTEDVASVCP